MKKNAFGDDRVDSANDDLGDYFDMRGIDASEVQTEISEAPDGKWAFEIRTSVEGDEVISSLEVFESEEAIRGYLKQWIDPDTIEVVG